MTIEPGYWWVKFKGELNVALVSPDDPTDTLSVTIMGCDNFFRIDDKRIEFLEPIPAYKGKENPIYLN